MDKVSFLLRHNIWIYYWYSVLFMVDNKMSDEHGLDETIAAYTKVWDSWHEPIDAKNIETVRKASLRAALSSKAEEVKRLKADLATYQHSTVETENRIIDAEFAETEAKHKLAAAESSLSRMKEALLRTKIDLNAAKTMIEYLTKEPALGVDQTLAIVDAALGELQSNQSDGEPQ